MALSQKETIELAKAKILHYAFNDDDIYDISLNGNHGVVGEATKPLWVSDSRIGTGSLQFSPGDMLETGVDLSMLPEYTITYWLDANSSGNWELVVIRKEMDLLVDTLASTDTSLIKTDTDPTLSVYGDTLYKIDDFRVYATILSLESIEELHKVMTQVDNKGNIFTTRLRSGL